LEAAILIPDSSSPEGAARPPSDAPEGPLPEGGRLPGGADRAAFTKIFRHFYAPLVRYARRLTGSAALADDVLQDVFAKLWEDRQRLAIRVSLKALLYTMVRNRALNLNRRKQWAASDAAAAEAFDRHGAEPAGEQALTAEDLRRHLYRWIDDLPPRRREAFTLSRYHGLSHREIAGIMGVSERTVDTHILLVLRELRRRLDDLQNEGTPP
jgi:RNA polymerase sigma-70 factor (family 1)